MASPPGSDSSATPPACDCSPCCTTRARLKLLGILAGRECDDVCACDLSDALELTPATISHHMKKLVDAGMVAVERRGRWAHYRLLPAGFAPLRAALEF